MLGVSFDCIYDERGLETIHPLIAPLAYHCEADEVARRKLTALGTLRKLSCDARKNRLLRVARNDVHKGFVSWL